MAVTYYLGVDGGTTRTKAVVGDDAGHIIGSGEGGASNYQIVGLEAAISGITNAVQRALTAANLSLSQIECTVFGLSGMDLPKDREVLNAALVTAFPGLVFDLVNDTWIMLKAGSNKGWGIALVCGGGANACACSHDGTWVTLRGLGYESGLRGGGLDMLRDILHYAFLSHDGTGSKSVLEQTVLDVTGAPDYDTLQLLFLEAIQDTAGHGELLQRALALVPLVFDGATAGDEVCKRILLLQAESLAEGITGLVLKMGFEREAVDVVLGGSVFGGSNAAFVDRLTLLVHEVAPLARLGPPLLDPVLGAYVMALQRVGKFNAANTYALLAGQVV
ncbi:MAG TPA: BadF/BadG/BcrA/BcrD ATPase family protein [Candidatus Cryosericum sp.]